MKGLKFDSNAMYQGLEKASVDFVNEVTYDMFYKIRQGLTGQARADNDVYYAKDEYYGHIHATIANYGYAILQSYGVGLGIDTSSPFLDEYKNSKYWNDLRVGNVVVGREEGTYETILGERYSKGNMAGVPLKWISQEATMVIQDVEKEYFDNGKAKDLIAKKMSEWIKANSHKYFKYG